MPIPPGLRRFLVQIREGIDGRLHPRRHRRAAARLREVRPTPSEPHEDWMWTTRITGFERAFERIDRCVEQVVDAIVMERGSETS
jgi:hypothetical protein